MTMTAKQDAVVSDGNNNVKSYGDGRPATIVAPGKSKEELNLEMAHAQLIATARMCEDLTQPKRVKVANPDPKAPAVYTYEERHMTAHNLQVMGRASITALAEYYSAHKAFELSER
jgi:hypothetical protein